MYRKIVNYLRGEAAVRCCSAAPERVLNLCSVHDIPFWDVVWEDAAHIRFRTTIHGRRELQQVINRECCMKYTPHLHFSISDSIAKGDRVLDILNHLDIPE